MVAQKAKVKGKTPPTPSKYPEILNMLDGAFQRKWRTYWMGGNGGLTHKTPHLSLNHWAHKVTESEPFSSSIRGRWGTSICYSYRYHHHNLEIMIGVNGYGDLPLFDLLAENMFVNLHIAVVFFTLCTILEMHPFASFRV